MDYKTGLQQWITKLDYKNGFRLVGFQFGGAMKEEDYGLKHWWYGILLP